MKILLTLIFLNCFLYAQEGEWRESGKMKYPVSGGEAIATDSLIYVVGGYSDSLQANVNWIQSYDPDSGKWNIVAEMKAERYGFQMGKYNNNLYIFGGVSGDSTKAFQLEVWNFIDDTTIVSSTNNSFDRIFSTSFFLDNGVLIVGGYSNFKSWDADLPYVIFYDFAVDSFFVIDDSSYQTGDLPIQRSGIEINDHLYLFGGDYNGVLQSFDEVSFYETNYSSISRDSRELSPRAGGAIIYTAANGFVYLIGGYNESRYSLETVEIITYLGDESIIRTDGPELNFPRRNLMAVTYGRAVYVLGGESDAGTVVNSIEVMDSEVTDVNNGKESGDGSTGKDFTLKQNYPNPFNPATKINYTLTKNQQISLNIYNTLGQKVIELYDGYLPAGSYSYTWDGKDNSGNSLPSGIYFYRLSAGNQQIVKKMLLLK